MNAIPDTNLLKVAADKIRLGDTLLAIDGEPQRFPRVVLAVMDADHLGPDFVQVSLSNSYTHTFMLDCQEVVVRRPVSEVGKKSVVDRLLISWRDAHFAAEYGGRDYTHTRACKELSYGIYRLEHGGSGSGYDEDEVISDLLERAYEGTDERYFMPPC